MNDMDDPFADSLSRICAHHAARGPGASWPGALWDDLEQAGFPRALATESAGGSGLGWPEAFALLAQLGETATPAPLAECMLAHWLAAAAGLDAGHGFVTLGAGTAPLRVESPPRGTPRITGELSHVPWGRAADRLLAVGEQDGAAVVLVIDRRSDGTRIRNGSNLAGEPRDRWLLDGAPARACAAAPVSALDLMAMAAACRSAQMAGALRAVLALSVEYASLREQFGRKLTSFQAIQHHLALLASQTAAALAAAQAGLDAIGLLLEARGRQPDAIADSIEVAAAKIRAGEAAGAGAAIAHQVFGAIGFTEEHSLHLHTKRLWSWRDEFGNEAFWSSRIGASIITAGPASLWARVTAAAHDAMAAAPGGTS